MNLRRAPGLRQAITLAVLLSASIAFTWPMAPRWGAIVLTRHFDVWSLLWLLGQAPHLGTDLFTLDSAWPLGQSLARSDSLLMWPLGALLVPIIGADHVVIGLFVLGPVLSGWAAERFSATALGARWPWTLIAGLAYGFCGLAATAVLEGHVYFLLNPWLPLLGLFGLRAVDRGRIRDAALAALMWALCLASTAYLGLVATALVLAGLVRGLRQGTLRIAALGAAAAIALPIGLGYVALFRSHPVQTPYDPIQGVMSMRDGSATLTSLVGWTPSMDGAMHSVSPTLPRVALVLALVAPTLLSRRHRAGGWLALTALMGALSLGPYINIPGLRRPIPGLLASVSWASSDTYLHFPARLLWLGVLLLGVLGAAAATRLFDRAHTRAQRVAVWLLLPLAWFDAAAMSALPLRGSPVPLAVPSAYDAAPSGYAILELLPLFRGHAFDLDLYVNNVICSYQRVHRRPLANTCIGTSIDDSPREVISRRLFAELLDASPPTASLSRELVDMGFGAVAFHPDRFSTPDRRRLRQSLGAALGEPAATSLDAGDALVLYALDVPDAPPDLQLSRQAYRDWTDWEAPSSP